MEGVLSFDITVRASYGEEIQLDRYDLSTIMVYDGCFLLELLISASEEWNSRLRQPYINVRPIGAQVGKREEVLSDLMLVENQIPIFILDELFVTCFDKFLLSDERVGGVVEKMALNFFGYSHYDSTTADHFVDLVYSSVLRKNNQKNQQLPSTDVHIDTHNKDRKQVELNCCVTRLEAAGIRVRVRPKLDEIQENSVIYEDFNFNVEFRDDTLEISPLHITPTTETKWQNLIAWERHRKKKKEGGSGDYGESEDKFIFFALLFNDLICCASDVQLLKNRRIIIVDKLGMSNHDLMDLFRSIAKGVDRGYVDSTDYRNTIDALNTYSATKWLVLSPVIVWHYLGRFSEWLYKFLKRGYNFAAALITLLTVIQTFYAVFSYHRPN